MIDLQFAASLPGLAPLTEFTLTEVPDSLGLYSLDSKDMPHVQLFLLDPAVHLPDYTPDLRGHLASVGSPAPDQLRTLVVVNASDGAPHTNLLAPIVINAASGTGAQIILDSEDYSVREPLFVGSASQS